MKYYINNNWFEKKIDPKTINNHCQFFFCQWKIQIFNNLFWLKQKKKKWDSFIWKKSERKLLSKIQQCHIFFAKMKISIFNNMKQCIGEHTHTDTKQSKSQKQTQNHSHLCICQVVMMKTNEQNGNESFSSITDKMNWEISLWLKKMKKIWKPKNNNVIQEDSQHHHHHFKLFHHWI